MYLLFCRCLCCLKCFCLRSASRCFRCSRCPWSCCARLPRRAAVNVRIRLRKHLTAKFGTFELMLYLLEGAYKSAYISLTAKRRAVLSACFVVCCLMSHGVTSCHTFHRRRCHSFGFRLLSEIFASA